VGNPVPGAGETTGTLGKGDAEKDISVKNAAEGEVVGVVHGGFRVIDNCPAGIEQALCQLFVLSHDDFVREAGLLPDLLSEG